jgi:hypothetical protein
MKTLTSYNLFTNLLPGVVFCILTSKFFSFDLLQKDLVTGVFFYYFVGVVIGRVGSLIIEPILKSVNFISFSNYSDFIDASAKDSKIGILSETNDMYRSLFAMTLALGVIKIYYVFEEHFKFISDNSTPFLLSFLFIIFTWSYRKQTGYVKKRVQDNLNKDS